ncbi:hypothetical protein DPMN_130253, partial [Dreissena polymorpha]
MSLVQGISRFPYNGQFCNLGPIPLTKYNIGGELQKGLSGDVYVSCENPREVNRVAYRKQNHLRTRGMPCFDVITNLGTGFTKLYPGQSHKHEDLVQHAIQATYNSHDALADVEALGSLLQTYKITDIMANSLTVTAIHNSVRFSHEK